MAIFHWEYTPFSDIPKSLKSATVVLLGARTSPMAPQPLLAGSAPATGAVQSGGGQEPDIGWGTKREHVGDVGCYEMLIDVVRCRCCDIFERMIGPDFQGLQKARYFFLADLSSLASDFSVAAKIQKRS